MAQEIPRQGFGDAPQTGLREERMRDLFRTPRRLFLRPGGARRGRRGADARLAELSAQAGAEPPIDAGSGTKM
jgi:hypothetical protein